MLNLLPEKAKLREAILGDGQSDFLFNLKKVLYFMYMGVLTTYICVALLGVGLVPRRSLKVLDPLDLELQTVVVTVWVRIRPKSLG